MELILEKWEEILRTVKEEHELTDVSFDTWLKPLSVYNIEGSTLYILVPSEQMGLNYITKKYTLPIKVAIAEITGNDYEIIFILQEQAKKYGHSEEREYAFLITHSMLHLFGYDHMEPEEARVMEDKQNAILHSLNILR